MSLESLPSSILLEKVFPLLSLRDTLSLSSVNKFFAKLGQDDGVWERRLRIDYGFTNTSIAGNRGLKFLYSRVFSPEFYVWGGMFQTMEGYARTYSSLPEEGMGPLQYWVPTSPHATTGKMVALPPKEWSFCAVGSSNDIYLLENGLAGNSLVHPGTWVSCPQPRKFIDQDNRRFSDQHGTQVIGGTGQGWRLTAWGNPFINAPKDPSLGTQIIQIQSGHKSYIHGPIIMAALAASGDVLVWGFHNELLPERRGLIQVRDQLFTNSSGGVNYVTLPGLPKLPHINGIVRDSPRIIQVAIGRYYIFGLTDGGHVVRYSLRNFRTDHTYELFDFLNTSPWEYLPQFCERERVERLSAFRGKYASAILIDFRITHIATHDSSFVAYSTGPNSVMLMDSAVFTQAMIPEVVVPLLGQRIVSVVFGDGHVGVLTEEGRVFTWARKVVFQPLNRWHVRQPREMKFDYASLRTRNYFVLAIASTQWEMGALVIDLGDKDPSIRQLVQWRPPNWQKFKFMVFHYVAGDHPSFGHRAWLRLFVYTVVVPATYMLQWIFPSGRAQYTDWRRRARQY